MTARILRGFYSFVLLLLGALLLAAGEGLSEHMSSQFAKEILSSYNVVFVAVALALVFFLRFALKKYVETDIKTTRLSTDELKEENAHKGLIVFLSMFGFTQASREELEKRGIKDPSQQRKLIDTALENLDYKALLLQDDKMTNFGLTTMAIKAHLKSLTHLWIITTKSTVKPEQSSERFLKLYEKFLSEKVLDSKVRIHDDGAYSVNSDEESQVIPLTSQVVQRIYKSASKKGVRLRARHIILDVSSGTKQMTVGAVLGSMQKERMIQVFAADYEPGVGVTKVVAPVIVEYEARLQLN